MTYNEKIIFLNSYQSTIRALKGLSVEYEKYLDIGSRISQQISAAPCGVGSGDKTGRAGIGMAEIKRQIEMEAKTAFELRQNVKAVIESRCSRARYSEILTLKYINGMTDREIADEYRKDTRTVKNALKAAVESLDI